MPETNLNALAGRIGINTLVGLINDSEVDMDALRIQSYYSKMMLDTIKIGTENYVFLKYAQEESIPKGHSEWLMRKKFGLTEHTTPLLEAIPPQADKIKREKITGTFHQYGRYMEFSDRVDFNLLDPIIMEYASEYGDVALRTLHRLARKEMLNSTMVYYANNKVSKGELVVGDYVGLADFRLASLKMARLAVKPIGGVYVVITSPEHYWDLMQDPLIIAYIGTNNGMEHYRTGVLPEIFGIRFEKTMLDEYAYGYELANTGEYIDLTGGAASEFALSAGLKCRAYLAFDNGYLYGNIDASGHRTVYVADEYKSTSDFVDGTRSTEEGLPDYTSVSAQSEAVNRLSDGSWIPIRAIWSFTACEVLGFGASVVAAPSAAVTVKTQIGTSSIYYTFAVATAKGAAVKGTGTYTLYFKYDDTNYELIGTTDELEGADVNTYPALTNTAANLVFPTARQLPVHTAIMIGEDALRKLGIEGEGNVQMFVKAKGSAGVLDPVDQRQSIGWKINTVGFKRVREEAINIFYHVPTQAPATASL